jgi:hypothetical protein
MTYTTPEVMKLDSAYNAIQGLAKPALVFFGDRQPPYAHDATMGAYESDE